MHPKKIREAHRLPRIVVAVRAGVSEPSVRLFEASKDAVTEPISIKLSSVYADLEAHLPQAS